MHRCLRRLVFSFLLCFSALLRSQSLPTHALPVPETYLPGLKTLLEEAVRQSPRMIARNMDEALTANQRAMTDAQRLPQVSGALTYFPLNHEERRGDPLSPYTSQKSAYSLNLSQPLYHWGALINTSRIAELQERVVKGQTVEAYRLLVSEIRSGYLQLIVKKAGLARTRESVKLTEAQLVLAQERFAKGQISEADLFGPTLGMDQARLSLERIIDDYESSKKNYAKLYGGEPLTDEQIPDEIPDISISLEACEELLADFAQERETRSYGLRIMQDQLAMEKLNYEIAQARLKPKVNLIVGTSQDEQSYTRNIGDKYGVTAYYAGVRVEWSIFDGFATRAIKRNALIRRRMAERNFAESSSAVLENARAKLRQLRFSVRGLELHQRQVRVNDENFRRTQADAARGQISAADLRSAEFNRAGALIDTYNVRGECLMRATDFISTLLADPALANLPSQLR